MKRLIGILILFMMIYLGAAAEAVQLGVLAPEGPLKGFQTYDFIVDAPFPGELTVTVTDGNNIWRTITTRVEDGESIFQWDTLGENRQELKNGQYILRFELDGNDGMETVTEVPVTLRGHRTSLRYALPSADVLYTDGNTKWFVEYSLNGAGTLAVDVLQNEELVGTLTYSVNDDQCYYRIWDGRMNNNQYLKAGNAVLSCYCTSDPDYRVAFQVEIREHSPETAPIGETGPIMAERGMTDAEIWEKMMLPSVVCTEGKLGHQKVYSAPAKDASSLGTLHGQTQAVEVLGVTDTGWALIHAWEHEDGAGVTGYVPLDKLKTEYPNGRYGLLIDKREQTATLYEEGRAVATFPVTTGKTAKNKLIRETAAGSFLTEKHEYTFSSEGYTYEFPLRYDGGNMIHQAGYKTVKGIRNFGDQLPELGTKASHGCIRIPPFVTDETVINAYWLWTSLPYHTRIMILDDPEERTAEALEADGTGVSDRYSYDMLIGRYEGPEEAYGTGEGETVITVTAGGDAVLGTRGEWMKNEAAFPALIDRYGTAYPFSGLQELFAADDMTLVNLECVLQDSAAGEKTGKLFRFRGPTSYTQILLDGSVEQVNLANNHYVDFQERGKVSTRNALKAAGVAYSGYSQLYVFEKDGHKIGFGGIREQIFNQQPDKIAKEVRQLREMGCEAVIYSCHWGEEYNPFHNQKQTEMALACAEAGVDIVIGGHPHVVQGVGNIDDSVILWSLGNLTFGGTIDLSTYDATLAKLELIFDEEGYKGVNVSMIPILTSSSAAEQINDYRPVPAEGTDRERILNLIRQDSVYEVEGKMFFRHMR